MKSRSAVAAVIILALIIGFAAWRRLDTETQSQRTSVVTAVTESEMAAPVSPAAAQPASPLASAPSATPVPLWENQIDQVLRSNVTEAQTAQILISMLPTLPEEGQIEAANHISNLLADENYDQVKPLLLNPNFSEPVLSVFFTDLMNRSEPVKLHAFLDIAKISNHSFHDEALSDLQIFLGEDYGTDWTKWNAALEEYLKKSAAQ